MCGQLWLAVQTLFLSYIPFLFLSSIPSQSIFLFDMLPIQLGILSCGEHAKGWKQISSGLDHEHWMKPWFVTKDLPKDPENGGVSREQGGRYNNTILQVFRQSRFAKVQIRILCSTVDSAMKLGTHGDGFGENIVCSQGNHRSDVLGMNTEEIANEIVLPNGTRLFNACHFGTSAGECFGWQGVENVIENANKWVMPHENVMSSSSNWCSDVMPGGQPLQLSERYGYTACRKDELAWGNFLAIHEFVTNQLPSYIAGKEWPRIAWCYIVGPAAMDGEVDADDVGGAHAVAAAEWEDGKQQDGEYEQQPANEWAWAHDGAVDDGAAKLEVVEVEDDEEQVGVVDASYVAIATPRPKYPMPPPTPPPFPPPPPPPGAGSEWWSGLAVPMPEDQSDHEEHSEQVGCADAPPFGTELPPWATFEFSAEAWYSTLEMYGVDQSAQRCLFLLSQLGDAGKQEANSVIRKLIYKGHNGSIGNPSAFVFSSCNTARQLVAPHEFTRGMKRPSYAALSIDVPKAARH